MGAYVLVTYKIQSDENIQRYLYPSAEVVRARAAFLEQNRLNVFGEPIINPSELVLLNSGTLFYLTSINGKLVPQIGARMAVNSSEQQTVTITGWAVDEQANDLAKAVFVTIDRTIDIPTLYGLQRPDVAAEYGNSKYVSSGFVASFSTTILSDGEHSISLEIVSQDGLHYYLSQQIVYLIVLY
jgi:hypothetical protein